MKYAIIEVNGKQFWVESNKYYNFHRIPTKLGKYITLNRVLLLKKQDTLLIGQPYLSNVIVKGKILEHLVSKKIIVYKMRSKKKTRRKQGYREKLTKVLVENIIIENKGENNNGS